MNNRPRVTAVTITSAALTAFATAIAAQAAIAGCMPSDPGSNPSLPEGSLFV